MPTDELPEHEPTPSTPAPEPRDAWAELQAIREEAIRKADEIRDAQLRGEGPEWWRI